MWKQHLGPVWLDICLIKDEEESLDRHAAVFDCFGKDEAL